METTDNLVATRQYNQKDQDAKAELIISIKNWNFLDKNFNRQSTSQKAELLRKLINFKHHLLGVQQ